MRQQLKVDVGITVEGDASRLDLTATTKNNSDFFSHSGGYTQPEVKRTPACRSRRKRRSESFVAWANRAFRTLLPTFRAKYIIAFAVILGSLSGCWSGDKDFLGKEIRGTVFINKGNVYFAVSDKKYDEYKFVINSIFLMIGPRADHARSIRNSQIIYECVGRRSGTPYFSFPLRYGDNSYCDRATNGPAYLAPSAYYFELWLSSYDDLENVWKPYVVRGVFRLDGNNIIVGEPD